MMVLLRGHSEEHFCDILLTATELFTISEDLLVHEKYVSNSTAVEIAFTLRHCSVGK